MVQDNAGVGEKKQVGVFQVLISKQYCGRCQLIASLNTCICISISYVRIPRKRTQFIRFGDILFVNICKSCSLNIYHHAHSDF